MANLYIGLVHYPIMNKYKDVITTAITNYDIHDIARASITYGTKTKIHVWTTTIILSSIE